MKTRIQKWGNSLGVRIPKNIAGELGIKDGVIVDLEISQQNLIIKLQQSNLDLLLDNITDDNCHNELFSNDDRSGNESW